MTDIVFANVDVGKSCKKDVPNVLTMCSIEILYR